MTDQNKPISGGQVIIPGPCTPHTPCPPIKEIVCIDVPKVFDSCSNVECQEFCFEVDPCEHEHNGGDHENNNNGNNNNGNNNGNHDDHELPVFVSCEVGTFTVGPITTSPVPGQPLLQRITADICAPVTVVAKCDHKTVAFHVGPVCFHKDVLLYMPNPTTMFGKIEVVTFTCLGGRFTKIDHELNVCLTIGLRAIVKSEGQVQLLVGAFGYCPVPPTCRELGTICEGFIAAPFPSVFPPEIFEVTPTNNP